MDARAFPHLLDAIVEAAAAEYASSSPSRYPWSRPLSPSAPCCLRPDSLLFPARPQPVLSSSTVPGAPLLALRATSRRVRDRFDAQLADHVAWTRGEWFTPKLRRIPSLYDPTSCTPAQSDLCLSDTPRSAQEAHPRILDVYDNLDIELFDNWNRAYTIDDTGDKGEDDLVDDMSKLIFPGLEVAIPLRGVLQSSPSLEEIVVLISSSSVQTSRRDKTLVRVMRSHVLDLTGWVAQALLYIVSIFKVTLGGFVASDGRVTFVDNAVARWTDSDHRSSLHILRDMLHIEMVERKYGPAGTTAEKLAMTLGREAERLKGNIEVITWDEWRAGASDLEIDWLDRYSVGENVAEAEEGAGAEEEEEEEEGAGAETEA